MDFVSSLKKATPAKVKEFVVSRPKLANLVDAILICRLRDILPYNDIHTELSANEREYLSRLAAYNKPENVIVEIGCLHGGSAYFLGKGAEKSGSVVYGIDPFGKDLERQVAECDGSGYLEKKPSKKEVEQNMRRHNLQDRVGLIEGWSQQVAQNWTIPIGLLFIDGNHKRTYDDYTAWKMHLAQSAVVVFHDSNPDYRFSIPDVSRDVKRVQREGSFRKIEFMDSITSLFI